jgi:hypothetical protein
MSKRLEVQLEDAELTEIRTTARRSGMTVAAWVRATLRTALAGESATDPQPKLRALSVATSHSFPTADIEEMLAEIGKGHATV